MKKLFLLTLLVGFSKISYSSCFNDKEYKLISNYLTNGNDDYYKSSPYNIADCKNKSALSELVCDNSQLKKSLLLLSMGEIYAYENATHTPVEDYSTYKDNKKTALRKLCYIIKTKLSDDFGECFYYAPKVHEIISSKTNKNGVVIDSLSRVIYLGKSCDAVVLGEEKVKSIWYKDGEQFVIVHKDNDGLLQEDYRFYLDDKVAKLNCDKP